MTFRLTENDLMSIIRDAAMLVLEGNYHNYYAEENICYSPYRVSIAFTDHSIEREDQRYISEKDVIDDAKQVINAIIEDWSAGNIDRKTAVRVINKETCRVTVLGFEGGRRLNKAIVVTCYIWDGRLNIDYGPRYYIGEESPMYLEAKKWNEENQDKVEGYKDWKFGNDVRKQMRKADNEYYYRNNTEMSPEKKMELINKTYDNQARLDKKAIHNAMDPDEFKAVQDYYKKVDKQPMSSKGSANRDLRAMDLWKRRKENEEE